MSLRPMQLSSFDLQNLFMFSMIDLKMALGKCVKVVPESIIVTTESLKILFSRLSSMPAM